jgi:hypothetical protein
MAAETSATDFGELHLHSAIWLAKLARSCQPPGVVGPEITLR